MSRITESLQQHLKAELGGTRFTSYRITKLEQLDWRTSSAAIYDQCEAESQKLLFLLMFYNKGLIKLYVV